MDLTQCDKEKGIGQWKHYLTTLQANTRSPGYGCYCIKYKQQWDSVKLLYQIQAILNLKFAVSNTGNIELEVRCIKYKQQAKGQ